MHVDCGGRRASNSLRAVERSAVHMLNAAMGNIGNGQILCPDFRVSCCGVRERNGFCENGGDVMMRAGWCLCVCFFCVVVVG